MSSSVLLGVKLMLFNSPQISSFLDQSFQKQIYLLLDNIQKFLNMTPQALCDLTPNCSFANSVMFIEPDCVMGAILDPGNAE